MYHDIMHKANTYSQHRNILNPCHIHLLTNRLYDILITVLHILANEDMNVIHAFFNFLMKSQKTDQKKKCGRINFPNLSVNYGLYTVKLIVCF